MKLLWRGEWIETPGYEVPADAVLISVAATVPLVTLKNASGRQQRRPGRKVAVFLYTDGPWITLRKARTKREEPRFTGDFRVTLVLGDAIGTGRRVVALACRVPSCAGQFAVHRELVLDVPDSFTDDDLRAVAGRLLAESDLLTTHGRQGFLYSGMQPPAELADLFGRAVSATGTPAAAGPAEVLRPPAREAAAADTVLPLTAVPPVVSGLPVAVLGGGDYTRSEIIPALRRAHFQLYAVANREPQIAATVGRDYGFALATADSERAIAELPAPGLVVVATAHDSHTQLACAAVMAGHRVFLEKPPTVTADDVRQLAATMRANPGAIEIGFNRRYHPLVRRARARLVWYACDRRGN
jgi:hypothetical protein